MIVFFRGCGGFGGQKKFVDCGVVIVVNKFFVCVLDVVVEEKIIEEQVVIYWLFGDYNFFYIDFGFVKMGGFKVFIFYGLCFFGIVGKVVYEKFGKFKNVKVRFVGIVNFGQIFVIEMWKEGNKVIFQIKVKEIGKLVIGGVVVELF